MFLRRAAENDRLIIIKYPQYLFLRSYDVWYPCFNQGLGQWLPEYISCRTAHIDIPCNFKIISVHIGIPLNFKINIPSLIDISGNLWINTFCASCTYEACTHWLTHPPSDSHMCYTDLIPTTRARENRNFFGPGPKFRNWDRLKTAKSPKKSVPYWPNT